MDHYISYQIKKENQDLLTNKQTDNQGWGIKMGWTKYQKQIE